jgi:protein-disulfide isomerase
VGFFLSTLSILLTVRMAYISHFVVESFCIGCATLWLVNLAIWPAFVKHMKLSWGNALAANLELFRPKHYQLQRNRIFSALGICAAIVVILATIGTVAENMQKDESLFGGEDHALQTYNDAKLVIFPPESLGGPQSKGTDTPVLDIVEFSDLQCPACRMAARFLKPFLMKYPTKVRFTYRHYPLDSSCNPYVPNGMHIFGCAAAKAGICAAKQNKFFEFHDYVFDNQENMSTTLLDEGAKEVGLDINAFQACEQDKATDIELQKQIEIGERTGGIESTPSHPTGGRTCSSIVMLTSTTNMKSL